MRRSRTSPKLPNKSSEFDQQLRWYVLAAAAGVGIAAVAQPSDAEVVYTPAHQQIAPNTTITIDLNNDGVADFAVKDVFSTSFFSSFGHMSAMPLGAQNRVWGHTVSRRPYASALMSGAIVGPNGQFLPGAGLMADISFLGGADNHPLASISCTAPWANVTSRYLGFKFEISGQVHFGWARLNVSCLANSSKVAGLLTGYAYETVPERAVIVGLQKYPEESESSANQPATYVREPASLARLAQGASGLSSWRKTSSK